MAEDQKPTRKTRIKRRLGGLIGLFPSLQMWVMGLMNAWLHPESYFCVVAKNQELELLAYSIICITNIHRIILRQFKPVISSPACLSSSKSWPDTESRMKLIRKPNLILTPPQKSKSHDSINAQQEDIRLLLQQLVNHYPKKSEKVRETPNLIEDFSSTRNESKKSFRNRKCKERNGDNWPTLRRTCDGGQGTPDPIIACLEHRSDPK